MKLFDVDGPLMAALNKLADLVFANLLFILFSLPVVTLGASLNAFLALRAFRVLPDGGEN